MYEGLVINFLIKNVHMFCRLFLVVVFGIGFGIHVLSFSLSIEFAFSNEKNNKLKLIKTFNL